jgi:hypothetical protein
MKGISSTTGMKWHWSLHPNNLKECAIYDEIMCARNQTARKIETDQIENHTRATMELQEIPKAIVDHQNIPRNFSVIFARRKCTALAN